MPRSRPSLAALLLLITLAGCTVAPAPQPVPPLPEAAVETTAPPLSAALHWSRNSAEHRAVFLQTFRAAAVELEALVAGRQPFTWAVVADADETLIDNSEYQKEREALGEGYTSESFNAWVQRQEATALPGARDFLETVRRLGGKVAVVTNRSDAVCAPTEANLHALRLPVDVVLCKPLAGPSDKAPRWRAVEEGKASKYLPPLEIVMWVGDNIQDFPGGSQAMRDGSEDAFARFGHDLFILPNTQYGSWQGNPQQ